MILNGKDVTDEEFFKRVVPLDKHFEKYMINLIIPEAVADSKVLNLSPLVF